MTLTSDQKFSLGIQAGTFFKPASPVDSSTLFAGRTEQIRRVIDAVNQEGQHAIIFGERGVGKTSLANVISAFLPTAGRNILAIRVNCDGSDNFNSLWIKVFKRIQITKVSPKPGFSDEVNITAQKLSEQYENKDITPDDVHRALFSLAESQTLITIMDELDTLDHSEVCGLLADTVKTLSDHANPATLVLVGVADTVDELITEHLSIERALVQIRMPRMSRYELQEIIEKGLEQLGMEIEEKARDHLTLLSQGLPHYTHLLSLHSVRAALDDDSLMVKNEHVEQGINKSLNNIQESIQKAHHNATMSARKDTLYSRVLLACALAESDNLGYFSASDVRSPMCQIMQKKYEISNFARHLNDFCSEDRGEILARTGLPRRYKFRFKNPLMQPYVIMQGLSEQLIDRSTLEQLRPNGF